MKIIPNLSNSYKHELSKIKHLYAQVMVLVLNKPFMNKTYWLNVLDKKFPFLVVVDHTNFINSKNYNNKHVLYVGNYLPKNHIFLKYDNKKMLQVFLPFLRKININIDALIEESHLFNIPFAQSIVDTDYYKYVPEIRTPIKNVYLANIDMIYPWDRGTNYSVELGEKAADLIVQNGQ